MPNFAIREVEMSKLKSSKTKKSKGGFGDTSSMTSSRKGGFGMSKKLQK